MAHNDEKRKYEMMIVLHPDISEEEILKKLEKIKKLIEKNKGEIFHEDVWGRKELAYPIKKQTVGFFYVLNFTSQEAKRFKEIDENLRLDNQVLRHLLITTPFDYEIKSYKEEEEEVKEPEEEKKPKLKKKEEKKEEKVEEKKPAEEKKKPEKKPIVKEIKPETPKVEGKPEKEEKKLESLDELDEKLKSIIEDPDITL